MRLEPGWANTLCGNPPPCDHLWRPFSPTNHTQALRPTSWDALLAQLPIVAPSAPVKTGWRIQVILSPLLMSCKLPFSEACCGDIFWI